MADTTEEEVTNEDECAICSTDLTEEFSRPETCYHRFHTLCLKTWGAIKLTCPLCRENFKRMFTYSLADKEKPQLKTSEILDNPVEDVLENVEMSVGLNPYDHTVCETCGGGDNEHQILLCDECDSGYHMYCLTPALTAVPRRQWYCPRCAERNVLQTKPTSNHRLATRTVDSNRIAEIVQRQLNIILSSSDEESDEHEFAEIDNAVLNDEPDSTVSSSFKIKIRKNKKENKKNKTGRRRRKLKRKGGRKQKERNISPEKERKKDRFSNMMDTRLSLNGVGASVPYFDDEEVKETQEAPDSRFEIDRCDILGAIINEQEKVLASGKLFKVENGKFKETEAYEKYREKLHNKMDNTHKRRLGMVVTEEEKSRENHNSRKNNSNGIDDSLIDSEVQEQMDLLSEAQKDMAKSDLYEAQKKALENEKREKREKRAQEERDKKIRRLEEDELRRREKYDRRENERRDDDRRRKEREREERRTKENRREEERKRPRTAEKQRNDEKYSRDIRDRRRSPNNEDKRRNETDKNREKQKRHNDVASSSNETVGLQNSINFGIPTQAPPDYGSLYGNPLLAGYPLVPVTDSALIVAQQQLLGAFPGGLPIPMPLAGAQMPPLAPVSTIIQPTDNDDNQKKKIHKDQATKIIESYSLPKVKDYYKDKKITRQQYSEIMKALVAEYRKSRSVEELKSKKMGNEIYQKARKHLHKAMDANKKKGIVIS